MTAQPADSPLTWSLVVPVKVLARAKSRLAVLAGPHRPELALAMAADTVAAALACAEVARVIAVTDDPQAAQELAGLGVVGHRDHPVHDGARQRGADGVRGHRQRERGAVRPGQDGETGFGAGKYLDGDHQ